MGTRRQRGSRWSPSVDTAELLERFLVAGATSFLGTRLYLAATGYPQIGGSGLHIAHLLWGGLGMLVGIVMMLGFLGRDVRMLAAIIAGAGWGLFIDELGKFVTSDVNYFFQPAISLIYLTFVLLYLVFRSLAGRQAVTPEQALAQALEVIQSGHLHGMLAEDRAKAEALLARCDASHPLVPALRAAVDAEAAMPRQPDRYHRVLSRLKGGYRRLRGTRAFMPMLLVMLTLQAVTAVSLVISEIVRDPSYRPGSLHLGTADQLKLTVAAIAGVMSLYGLVRMRKSRLSGLEWLQRAVLVSLLVGQLLAFYTSQLLALWALVFHLVLLVTLNFAISQERSDVS